MKVCRVGLLVCASLSLSLLTNCGVDAPDSTDNSNEGIVRGKIEKKLPQVVGIRTNLFNGGWIFCSGTYISSRVVVTAAHCLRPGASLPGQTYVYYGDDYPTDVLSLPHIPAPGQPSVWARAETATQNPNYNASLNYPDLAILWLDRELPFDPIPLLRTPVTDADNKGDIVGWGGSKALTADISQVEGAFIKRSAKVKLLGSPTDADFHPDDPNPGILEPTIQPNLLKTDGMAPSANTCAGDSGGPLLIKQKGTTYLAGVGFWTGLFCEDYAIFTRVQPFLAYFDDAIAHADKAPIIPRLECIEPQGEGGSFTAHYSYSNDNALTVGIPYGPNNLFAADTTNARPSAFMPGDQRFVFAVSSANGGSQTWKLTPPGGPSTTVTANASSPACDPTDPTLACAKACDNQLKAECAIPGASRPQCIDDCVFNDFIFNSYFACGAEWNGYLGCVTSLPSAAANWDCSFAGFPPVPASPACETETNALFACLGYI